VYKSIIAVIILLSFTSQASETEALTVDRSVVNNLELAFPNDKNVKPELSEFELINYVLMSNESGERWAVITLKNSSSGSRVLNQKHLMALFANGRRKSPGELKLNFEAQEIQSITVSFGTSEFPILAISSST